MPKYEPEPCGWSYSATHTEILHAGGRHVQSEKNVKMITVQTKTPNAAVGKGRRLHTDGSVKTRVAASQALLQEKAGSE